MKVIIAQAIRAWYFFIIVFSFNAACLVASEAEPLALIPPSLGKAFSPSTMAPGGISGLVITLSNPNPTQNANLTSPLTDELPMGVRVSGSATTTCPGASVTTTLTTVTLESGSITANQSCTVTVPVTATLGGNYTDVLGSGALQTSVGSNTLPTVAFLRVRDRR